MNHDLERKISFSELSSDVFGEIASYLDAHDLLILWLTGGTQIHNKMNTGIQQFNIEIGGGYRTKQTWPTIVSQFKGLRKFSWLKTGTWLQWNTSKRILLEELPPQLQELELLGSDTNLQGANELKLHVIKSLPRFSELRTLKLCPAFCLDTEIIPLLQKFPLQNLQIELRTESPLLGQFLPKSLQTLSVTTSYKVNHSHIIRYEPLPPYLQELEVHGLGWTPSWIIDAPSSLKSLVVDTTVKLSPTKSSFPLCTEYLPSSLTSLKYQLTIHGHHRSIEAVHHFPPRLRTLHIVVSDSSLSEVIPSRDIIKALPQTLTDLEMSTICAGRLPSGCYLPQGLETMGNSRPSSLKNVAGMQLRNLRTVDEFRPSPNFNTIVDLAVAGLTDATVLPPCLLTLSDITATEEFGRGWDVTLYGTRLWPRTITRLNCCYYWLRNLRKGTGTLPGFGLEILPNLITLHCTPPGMRKELLSTHVQEILPQTLTYLDLSCVAGIHSSCLNRFPNLKTLRIGPTAERITSPQDILAFPRGLTALKFVFLGYLEREHLKALPPRLTSLHVNCMFPSELGIWDLQYLPRRLKIATLPVPITRTSWINQDIAPVQTVIKFKCSTPVYPTPIFKAWRYQLLIEARHFQLTLHHIFLFMAVAMIAVRIYFN